MNVAHEFRLPDIGEGLTEAEIVRWLVPVGGSVEMDAALVEVETDKAVVEIPSPFAGAVLYHGAAEGITLQVGAILAVIGEVGETWSADGRQVVEAPPIVGTLHGDVEPFPPRGTVRALPVVRKFARELGIELESVSGTGPGGKITREDVIRSAESAPAPILPSG